MVYKKISLICVLLLILTLSLMLPVCAFADYADVMGDPNVVLDFNQIFNNTISRGNYNTISFSKNNTTYSVSGYFTNYSLNIGFNETSPSIAISANHKYYLDFNLIVNSGAIPNLLFFTSGGAYLNSGNEVQMVMPSSNSTTSLGFHVLPSQNSSSNPYNFSVTPILIDLTQMFGSGNEPTLQEAKDLFIAESYSYTLSSPMSYSSIEAYNNGVNSVLSATTFDSITPSDFYRNFTSYTYLPNGSDVIYSGIVQYLADDWNSLIFNSSIYDSGDYSDALACGYLPLARSLVSGSNCTISVYAYGDFGSGSTTNNYFNVCAVNSSGQVITIASSPILGTQNIFASTIEFSFDVPFNADYILIVPKRSGNTYYFKDFQIKQRIINLQLLEESNYKNGYSDAETFYKKYYGSGGSGYQAIYQRGWNAGHDAPEYDFKYLITATVDTPLQAFTSLFDFDILGVNMKTFYLSLFTLAVIITIIKMVL